MSAPVTQFVDITINLTGAVAEKFGFGTPIGVFDHSVSTERIEGPFIDIAGVNEAGFDSTESPEINAWATAIFAQENGVDQLVIGRQIPSGGAPAGEVWQVVDIGPVFVEMTDEFNGDTDADWLVLPTTDAVDNYAAIGYPDTFAQISLDNANGTAGVAGTVTWEYWNGAAWAALTGVTDGTTDFTIAVADGQIVTWTVPGDWAAMSLNGGDLMFYVRAVSDGAYSTSPIYDQGFVESTEGDANWTATMDAIEAYEQVNPTKAFYGINIESRVKADILEVAAWTEPRFKLFGCQSADADILTAAASNLFETLAAFNYTRTWGIYHATSIGSDGYLDGAWMSKGLGLNLDVPGGVGIWGYMELAGVTGDNITPTAVLNIYANDGNVYTDAGDLTFTSNGLTSSGEPQFIDVTTSVDWLEKRSQEAILALLVGTQTKIPYTDGGINQVVSSWQGVLDAAVNFLHLSPDDPPKITAPLISEVSAADKASRTLTLTAEATLAGAIQKVVLVLNLSF